MSGPSWLDEICGRIVERLQRVEGIEAIALGGSRARDTARPDSDADIGLYYDPDAPFSVKELDVAARDLDDRHIPKLMTRFGDRGAGVNGGGWFAINGRPVDFLYRSLRHVREMIERCCEGKADAVLPARPSAGLPEPDPSRRNSLLQLCMIPMANWRR